METMAVLVGQLAVPSVETVKQRDSHVGNSIERIAQRLENESFDLVMLPEL